MPSIHSLIPRAHGLVMLCSLLAGSGRTPAAEDPFQALVRPTEPLSPALEQAELKVPEGFELSLFASEPMINKPINLGFDERDRVWISSTVEYPFPAHRDRWVDAEGTRVRDSRDAIKILEDRDRDGRADAAIDFADGLNIPIGVLPWKNGCIAWSIPNIWFFEDTDGDDRCDRRTILFGPLGFERDTHGNIASLRAGNDGWIYATHGFSNTSHIKVRPENLGSRRAGEPGTELTLQSGNVFRFRPDGSAVEPWSWGQVNPFGICFDSYGNLYSADCHSYPITHAIRGAHYQSFGKPDDGLGFGPVMCPHSHDSTGLCGLVYLENGIFGKEWDNVILLGNVITSRINSDRVSFSGSTPTATATRDFLVSGDPWFRPVDLRFGPDGALYVADFYNRIIGHYEVDRNHPGRDRERGRIWRIVRRPAPAAEEAPEPARVASELRRRHGEPGYWSPAVERDALASLGREIDPRLKRVIVEVVSMHPSAGQAGVLAEALLRAPANDPSLRHTLKVALRESLKAGGSLPPQISDDLVAAARAANTPAAAAWLLDYLGTHSLEAGEMTALLTSLARQLPAEKVASLAELARARFPEDMGRQLPLWEAVRAGIAERGGRAGEGMTQWTAELAARLVGSLSRSDEWTVTAGSAGNPWAIERRPCADGIETEVVSSLPMPRGGAIERMTATLSSPAFECPDRLTFWLCGHRGPPARPAHEKNFIRLLDAATGVEYRRAYPPRSDTAQKVTWDLAATVSGGTAGGSGASGRQVRLELVDGDAGEAYAWLAVGRIDPPAVKLRVPDSDRKWRVLATMALELGRTELAGPLAAALTRPDLSDATRSVMARALVNLPAARDAVDALFKVSPTRLQHLLAGEMASTTAGAVRLCDLAPPQLLAAPDIAQKIKALKDPALDERVKVLTADLPPADAGSAKLIVQRLGAFADARAHGAVDPRAGERVFAIHCATCHRIAGTGAVVAPQLDGIGNRGLERLCEDTLDPNRAVDPQFRVRVLQMKDGSVASGLVRRDDGAVLVLADATGKESTVPKTEVARSEESPLSLMPATFGLSIPPEDFNHLMAYLLEQSAPSR